MKNNILILLSCISLLCNAQTTKGSKNQAPSSSDIQKMMDDAMKNLSPEEQQMAKDMFKNMSPQIDNAVNAKPAGNTISTSVSDIGTKTAKVIGPEGGEIKSGNGKITLKFPAGAVSKKTEISIEEIAGINESSVGNSFQLLPEGLQFGQPVKLTFKYDENDLSVAAPEDFIIITENNNGDLQFSALAQVDTNTNSVYTEIRHFSKWSLGAKKIARLLPKETTLVKGESVNLNVQVDVIVPLNINGKEDLYKQLKEKQKQLRNDKFSTDVEQLDIESDVRKLQWEDKDANLDKYIKMNSELKKIYQTDIQKKTKLVAEIKQLRKELGISEDDMATFLVQKKKLDAVNYTVKSWRLNTAKAPVTNSFGTLTPTEKLTAKYTTPKLFAASNAPVMVYADVLVTGIYKKPVVLKLSSKIYLLDKGYLNYTFDAVETKTLEFAFSTRYQDILKKDVDKALDETPVAQAIFGENILEVHTSTSAMVPTNYNSIDVLVFRIKNPHIGINQLMCDEEVINLSGHDGSSYGQIKYKRKGINSEYFDNVLMKRRGSPDNCNEDEECVPFEINLTEFDLETKKVTGTFNGKIFEDIPAKKSCANSYQHILSGSFSLSMITNPEESFTKQVYDPKNRPSQQYDKPESKPESSSTPSDDDDLKPLKPSPKPKPKPKPKTNNDEIKPFE